MDEDLAAFCRTQYPRLVGSLSLYCGDRDVAEELAQEALLRAMERWSTLTRHSSANAWLHRVAFNLAHSWYRRRQAERRAVARSGGSDPAGEADPAARLAVRAAVAALPRRQRACVVWRFYLGWSTDEVASALGITPAGVASLTYRAVQRLRSQVGEQASALEEVHDDG